MLDRTEVMVLPGYGASDLSTVAIRGALTARGHRAHGWGQGRNLGPRQTTNHNLHLRLLELRERSGRPVALVGWSLGGLYSHWLGRSRPDLVHSVTSLGSPLRVNGGPPPILEVPTTSIYSRNDLVVPWRASLIDDRAWRHQNIEVLPGHLSMGFDPLVMQVIACLVKTDPTDWEPFEPAPALRPLFPRPAG